MNQQLDCILLIDDDEDDNYIHQLVISDVGCAKKVVSQTSGIDALNYLKTKENGEFPQPDMIFLDINMPKMNGWEFLNEYNKLNENQQAHIVVVMLTTSSNPEDRDKASSLSVIQKFHNKPLTEELLKDLIAQHFPEKFAFRS